jgi:hypothetical protein
MDIKSISGSSKFVSVVIFMSINEGRNTEKGASVTQTNAYIYNPNYIASAIILLFM